MSSSYKKYSMEELISVSKATKVIGSKYAISIFQSLLGGTKRFGEIQRDLNNVNPRTLSKRLKELEKEGFLSKKVYPEVPPRVEYTLTKKGEIFKSIVSAVKTCDEKIN